MQSPVWKVVDAKVGRIEKVDVSATVCAAVGLMNEREIGSVLVFEGTRLVGIFTERDVLVRVVGERRDPTTLLVGEVMSTELNVVEPSTTVEEAMAIMTARRHRHLPVVDGDQVVGLVSAGDLTRWVIRDQQRSIYDLTDYIQHA
ncbi:MAG: CBS domain-containing protein [Myxococcales bacterium]|nr:CBS domain-containing protein [Myxococcales bacterium]